MKYTFLFQCKKKKKWYVFIRLTAYKALDSFVAAFSWVFFLFFSLKKKMGKTDKSFES